MPANASSTQCAVSACLQAVQQQLEETVLRADTLLHPVCAHLLTSGQRLRSRFLLTTCGDLSDHKRRQRAIQAASSLELLHAATLIQDDIFDEAHLRRGRVATHLLFGKNLATLASDWLLMESVRLSMSVHPEFPCLLLRAAQDMITAEARELSPPLDLTVAEASYHVRQVALGKTGALFAFALAGAAILKCSTSLNVEALWVLGKEIGLTFQIVDDCNDIYTPANCADKDTRHDLDAGRLTFTSLAALEHLEPPAAAALLAQLLGGNLTSANRRLLGHVLSTDRLLHHMKRLLDERLREHAFHVESTNVTRELRQLLGELQRRCCIGPQTSGPEGIVMEVSGMSGGRKARLDTREGVLPHLLSPTV